MYDNKRTGTARMGTIWFCEGGLHPRLEHGGINALRYRVSIHPFSVRPEHIRTGRRRLRSYAAGLRAQLSLSPVDAQGAPKPFAKEGRSFAKTEKRCDDTLSLTLHLPLKNDSGS